MKILLVTLLLAVLLMSGSALKCKYCAPPPGGRCTVTTETCIQKDDACVSGTSLTQPPTPFKKCMTFADCSFMRYYDRNVLCCQTDLCN